MDPTGDQLRSLSTLINAYKEIGWNYAFWFVESRNNLLQGCTILEIRPSKENSNFISFLIFDDGEVLILKEEQ